MESPFVNNLASGVGMKHSFLNKNFKSKNLWNISTDAYSNNSWKNKWKKRNGKDFLPIEGSDLAPKYLENSTYKII